MITDNLTIEEIEQFNITSLSEAMDLLGYTKDDIGRYFYDGGHDEPFEANEASVRAEIQTIERFQPTLDSSSSDAEAHYHHKIRIGLQAYNFILEDIMARPGYIPLADRPEPQWKIDARNYNVTTLAQALNSLELSEKDDGTFFYDGDDEEANIIIDEEYCRQQLAYLERNAPENDEGIDFHPYHNNRQWRQAYQIVLDELSARSLTLTTRNS